MENINQKGNQYTKALHIEVPRDEKEKTYRMLQRFLGSTARKRILERDPRMVPTWKSDLTSHQKTKITHLIDKQHKFLRNISTALSYDLVDIDYVSSSLHTSLRQIS